MCKLGWGPNIENFEKKFYRQCKLGWDDEINFAKISFLSHSLMHEFYSCNFIFKDILHLANV
ncbi:hypothetical protein HMPREF3240_01470 [Staphylococcus aureus]|nr:hypothetical protein T647_06260 [Staphylococcus aureus MRSN 8613]KMR41550.1 hypothetical protein EY02_01805 [Staphylococcus aureus]KMR62093.1 hypothetical protein EX86_01830 [Staphylococcus aureus]OFK38251.1 hypothetical protein HMPREF2819_12585 [Staphylococcus aureus]OHR84756.1 hypothetical protein HMPREF3240_01470 [Staphylococcus aureus]